MEVSTLKVEAREATGTNQVARLRQEGRVPGVIYGGTGESSKISMDSIEVERELRQHHRVFKLEVGGNAEAVYMQSVQFDCVTDVPLHIDFLRIDIEKPMEVDIELQYVGHAKGEAAGGALIRDEHKIALKAKPLAIPYEVEVPIKHLEKGDTIKASDLELPEGCELNCSPDLQICHMTGIDEEEVEEQPAE